ncbi:hypothetical protein SRA_07451 [Streptococcus ratti FA-1 = DSM 20564]|uniref:Uncharacterized protein n=1 Tax=Streptococcus ratti FA-1 = DSM 20564 TaxID=699248 RepID=A0ABP2QZ37_STRRT|nr:hypothetical protein SRA_07451 [Streptococcus ratti FA-1 = DSM 20564]
MIFCFFIAAKGLKMIEKKLKIKYTNRVSMLK